MNNSMWLAVVFMFLMFLMFLMMNIESVVAEELVVDPSSCSDQKFYCEIQAAIDAASDGDVVQLKDGEYELWQQSLTIDKSITLQGQSRNKTVLLGEGNAPSALIVVTSNAENVVLGNLTIANRIVGGSPTMGPGGLDHRGGDLTIDNVAFRDNRGGWGGAARITSLFGAVHIKNSSFNNNTGFAGGGLAVYDGSALELLIESTLFTGNNAVFSGGALLTRDVAEIKLDSVEIRNNSAGNTGGGVHTFTDTGTADLTIVASSIVANDASKVGGISTRGADITVTLQDSQLQSNRSRDSLPTADCGGVSFSLIGENDIDQLDRCQ